jgi:hypothetical protein
MTQMTHRTVAIAQIGLSILFIVGYFITLGLFILGYIRTPPVWKDAIMVLLGVVTGSVGTVIAYWFSRQRQSE